MKTKWTAIVLVLFVLSGLCLAQDKESDKEKIIKTKQLITDLEMPLEEYATMHPYGKYPEASEDEEGNGTVYLVEGLRDGNFFQFSDENLTKDEPYQLVDGWGNPMRYHSWKGKKIKNGAHNRKSYDLWSAGPDGEFDTEDDITNWSTILETINQNEEIEEFFNKYFAAMNSYDAEKSLEFYYIPKDKLAEFKKSLDAEMTAMKETYGDQPFIRNFELKRCSFVEKVAKVVYESEFYIIEKKEWSKSESSMNLVKIGGKWKIDIFSEFKVLSVEAYWLTAASAMHKIIDAIKAFEKDSGSLEVLASDVWKPVSHIMGAIKLDSEVLTNLDYFDLEDFHYITRKIEGKYYYRLICIAWGGKTGGKTGNGPQIGYRSYDSEKDVFFEDFRATQYDGLGSAKVEITEAEPGKDVEIDEATKTAIMAVIDGFFKSINTFDVEAVQKYIYIPADLKEKAEQRLSELFAELKKNSTDKDGNYVKDWELKKLEPVGKKALATMNFFVFTDGEWEPNRETYALHWLEDKWVIDFFELIKEEEETPKPEENKDKVTEKDVTEASKINMLIDELFKGFNAYDDDQILEYIFVPEGKGDEIYEKIDDLFITWLKLEIPEDQELFKDWTVNNVKIDGDKAIVRVEYWVFQDAENGYYEDNSDWLCVKIDGKWVVDLFLYSNQDLKEEEKQEETVEELKQEIEALREEIRRLKEEIAKLKAKSESEDKTEHSESDDEEAIENLFNRYCEQINKADAEELAKMIYLPNKNKDEFKLQIKKWVENLVSDSGDTDAFVKNWKIVSVNIQRNIALLEIEITVFKDGEWSLKEDEIKFVKCNNVWFFDMLELYEEKAEESPEIPDEPDVDEDAIRESLYELFDAVNTRKVEELAKHVYLPEDKKEKYTHELGEFLESLIKDAEDDDQLLVKEVNIKNIEINSNKAVVDFDFRANSGDEWVKVELKFEYVKIGEKWLADFYGFAETKKSETEKSESDVKTKDAIKTLIDNFFNAMNECDIEKTLGCLYVKEENQDTMKEMLLLQFKDIKEKLGDKKLFESWEIEKYTKISDTEYELKVKLSIYASTGGEASTQNFKVIKSGEKWLVDLTAVMESEDDDDDGEENDDDELDPLDDDWDDDDDDDDNE